MRLPPRPRRRIEFNPTPIIDVVFNLVIFFLVTSHFARSEPSEAVTLPTASQTSEDQVPRRLNITVQANGAYSVSGNPVDLDDIEQMIEEGAGDAPEAYAVRIRGDRQAPYRFVEPVLLACARHGVRTFGFKVTEQ
jgi:biopolymer transport protein ExbD